MRSTSHAQPNDLSRCGVPMIAAWEQPSICAWDRHVAPLSALSLLAPCEDHASTSPQKGHAR